MQHCRLVLEQMILPKHNPELYSWSFFKLDKGLILWSHGCGFISAWSHRFPSLCRYVCSRRCEIKKKGRNIKIKPADESHLLPTHWWSGGNVSMFNCSGEFCEAEKCRPAFFLFFFYFNVWFCMLKAVSQSTVCGCDHKSQSEWALFSKSLRTLAMSLAAIRCLVFIHV